MLECPKCHAQNLPNSHYCDECGSELTDANKETVGTLPTLPAESELLSNETQLQSVVQAPSNTITSTTSDDISPQLTLPANSIKAAHFKCFIIMLYMF